MLPFVPLELRKSPFQRDVHISPFKKTMENTLGSELVPEIALLSRGKGGPGDSIIIRIIVEALRDDLENCYLNTRWIDGHRTRK